MVRQRNVPRGWWVVGYQKIMKKIYQADSTPAEQLEKPKKVKFDTFAERYL